MKPANTKITGLQVLFESATALFKVFVWLGLASYVSSLPTKIQPQFYSLWLVAFLIVNAQKTTPTASDRSDIRERVKQRFVLHWRIFLLIGSMLLTVIVWVPWMWALKSGHCVDHLAYARDFVPRPLAAASNGGSWKGTLFMLLAVAPFPLAEEFGFRKWLFTPLQRRFGSRIAVIVTSVLFALGHLRPSTFGTDLIFGFLMGYALLSTGTLVTPVLLHYATNVALAFLSVSPFAFYFKRAMATRWFSCPMSLLVYILGLLALAVLMVTAYRRRLESTSPSGSGAPGVSGENAVAP